MRGRHNAGHTVIFNGSRFVLQLIPCGILRPGKHAVIGSGVVVDPAALVAELDTLAKSLARILGAKSKYLAWPSTNKTGATLSARDADVADGGGTVGVVPGNQPGLI